MIRLCLIGFSLLASAAIAFAQANAAAPAKGTADAARTANAAAKTAYRELKWDELVPKDWDPFKEMKEMNFAGLSDSDPRAEAMLKRMREFWDNAPVNAQLNEQAVRIPGYLVPLDDGGMKEFLLVPYFGACIHTPPPPANQIVHVVPRSATKGYRAMDTVWVSGTLKAVRADTAMGASGYRLDAVIVEPYVDKAK
ncbi:MAG: DUF3299 domain-containing protein [Burkholderiaceae bacterium]